MIKLIALDMDGTLLQKDRTISPRNQQAIKQAKALGIIVVLASGRPREGLQPYLEQLGLTGRDDVVISYNGALVQYVASGDIIEQTYLKGHDVKKAFKLSQQLGLYIHAFSTQRGLVTHQHNEWTYLESTTNSLPVSEVNFNLIDDDEDFIKAMLVAPEHLLTPAIANIPAAFKTQYTVVRSAPIFVEVLNPESNKGIALEKLCNELDIKASQVMCVGDAPNDHAMFAFSGLAVAMGNADDVTKALSDHITATNADDGVALAIEEKAIAVQQSVSALC